MWEQRRGSAVHDIREAEERQKSLTTLSTEVAMLGRRGRRGFNINTGY